MRRAAIFLAAFFAFTANASAQEFTSTNFRISAPVLAVPGGYQTSSNFQLFGALEQLAIGTSTITNFELRSGFLYYPFVNASVVTATAGDGQVSLSWTAAVGAGGWTVSGYSVGQSTVSGSGYAYTSVGNVLATTVTGLTNGTTYYFVVRALDAFSETIATSSEVSATPSGAAAGGGDSGGPIRPVRPIFERVISLITGEAAPSPGCVRRSDLNCDKRVNLQDLSILLSRPPTITGRVLSYLFSDWTDALPVPRPSRDRAPVVPGIVRPPMRAFAQVESLLTPPAPEPAAYRPQPVSIFRRIANIVSYAVRAIIRLFTP